MFFIWFTFISLSCGLLAFVSKRKHLLNTLLSLEYIMLSIFWSLSMVLSNMGSDSFFLLFFLVMAACEGALGLGILVSMVRSHGNDNFSSFSLLEC